MDASVRPTGTADLERRTVTAIVYAVVVLAAVVAPWPVFAALVAILGVLGYIELRALFRYRPYQPWLVGLVFALLFIAAHLQGSGSPSELTVWTVLIVIAFGVVAILVWLAEAARRRPYPAVFGAICTLGGDRKSVV